MSKDTIYREDAIEAVEKCLKHLARASYTVRTAIEAIPSVDVDISEYSDKLWRNAYERGKADRPQGEWIIHYRDKWMVRAECPKCHRRFEFSPRAIWKCCPMCETRMKGADYEADNNKSKQ